LYKAEKARNLDFYRSSIVSSDWESLARYILTGRVAFIPDPVAVWRIHGRNATRTMSVDDRIMNLQQIVGPFEEAAALGVFPRDVIESWFDSVIRSKAADHASYLIRSGDEEGEGRFMAALDRINPRACAKVEKCLAVRWARTKHAMVRPRT
jgi:hypothetical protein